MKILFFLLFSLCGVINAQFVNYQVNTPAANQPNEVSITINPVNPNSIAAGSNLYYLYLSEDAGKTWIQKQMSSLWRVWGDPCLVYDASGNLFYGHLSDQRNTSRGYWIDRIVVQRSTNNGMDWDADAGIGFNPPVKQQDKEWLTADITNSPFRNNLYLAWTEFDQYGSSSPSDSSRILFSRSTNSGISWTDPIRVNTKAGDCIDDDNTVEGAVPTVGPNGEIYISWSGPLGIVFGKSLDGGVTFLNNKHVANLNAGWAFNIPGINRANGLPITGCDISNSRYRGNIYINWSDQKDGDTDIYFARSTDGGNTWNSPIKVNNDILKRHQFFNWMSVDPKTGIIYVIFYDRRDNYDPNSLQTHVYIARSDDGGETFKNYRISESPFFPNSSIFFGDYTNIAAYNGRIHPIWMRLDGNAMSVWTATIKDSELTEIEETDGQIITSFNLFQNYPNPFNPNTTINYNIPVESFIRLKVYDVLGTEVGTLVNEIKKAGTYKIEYNSGRLSSGVYLYRLEAVSIWDNTLSFIESKKMIMLK